MKEHAKPDAQTVWRRYLRALAFNSALELDAEVENNENFFIGKQWEGVQSNGLPTPVFNFLKRVTLFTVASVTTDNLKMQATPLGNTGARGENYRLCRVLNDQFEALFEQNRLCELVRQLARNAAVDGDGCLYTYWDAKAPGGGGIVTEVVENTRVHFGNPNDRRVQTQPYIIVERTLLPEQAEARAKELGVDPERVRCDWADRPETASERLAGRRRVTVLLYFYKDEAGGVRCCECTRDAVWHDADTGLRRYPVTWLNWDYRLDNYHGQSLISGLIPNQIFINKLFAMSMISLMTTAYPRVIYDKTRIARWDSRVGAAIGISGGDVASAARIIDPAAVSPQIAEFIKLAVDYTETFLGATPVALGDGRADNTSAIIALQRAAATPHELTRQNLYAAVEELGRIYLDFMGAFYGRREVELRLPEDIPQPLEAFAGVRGGQSVGAEFDFGVLRTCPVNLRLDVGASAYWSEIASMQTLDNLLSSGKIELEDYLQRVPDGYISQRQELLSKLQNSRRLMGRMGAALKGEREEAQGDACV